MSARPATRVLAPVLVAGALALSLGTASASSLPVAGVGLSSQFAQGCTATPISVTKTQPITLLWWVLGYRGVQLSGIPAACAGLPLELTVHDAAGGAVQTTFSIASAVAGTTNLSTTGDFGGLLNATPAYAMTVDGWSVPTSG